MRSCFAIVWLSLLLVHPSLSGQPGMEQRGGQERLGAGRGPKETAIERWIRMTPDERRRALEKLPPERRREIQQKIERFRNLPPEERRALRQRYELFSRLPAERQNEARQLFRRFRELPPDRRWMVRREFAGLRAMPDAERQARMSSEEFRSRYTVSEQQMLQDLTLVFRESP